MPTPQNPSRSSKSRKISYRELQQQRQRRRRITMAVLIGLAAIAIVVVLILSNRPVEFTRPEPIPRSAVNGNSVGDPNAPVKVEEFSDFRCVHCAAFWRESEQRLIKDYVATGKVYFTYVPFSFISDESFLAAEAAYCAMDQGKFWEFHDYIFANYDLPITEKLLRAFAQDLKLDLAQYDNCMASGKYRQKTQEDGQYARSKGVTGTPTFDVNGTLVGQTELFATIEKALAAGSQP
ncbi:thioredoxin domain-containing protein [uncultured Thermanaerothrix sp.]|uniref:DsbA family protein n=1 Tax=uncultured Thermanaerothrix sp. TaxID=1195149 RepID=UPI00261E4D42|nr:thioredoxin domain-containing protein [uncultured Thermanaerothrix sp.]